MAEWGSGVSLHGSNPEPLMSALGQKRTFSNVRRMSALPPKADIADAMRNAALCQKRTSTSYSITRQSPPAAERSCIVKLPSLFRAFC
jgi:hypothetical protein